MPQQKQRTTVHAHIKELNPTNEKKKSYKIRQHIFISTCIKKKRNNQFIWDFPRLYVPRRSNNVCECYRV